VESLDSQYLRVDVRGNDEGCEVGGLCLREREGERARTLAMKALGIAMVWYVLCCVVYILRKDGVKRIKLLRVQYVGEGMK